MILNKRKIFVLLGFAAVGFSTAIFVTACSCSNGEKPKPKGYFTVTYQTFKSTVGNYDKHPFNTLPVSSNDIILHPLTLVQPGSQMFERNAISITFETVNGANIGDILTESNIVLLDKNKLHVSSNNEFDATLTNLFKTTYRFNYFGRNTNGVSKSCQIDLIPEDLQSSADSWTVTEIQDALKSGKCKVVYDDNDKNIHFSFKLGTNGLSATDGVPEDREPVPGEDTVEPIEDNKIHYYDVPKDGQPPNMISLNTNNTDRTVDYINSVGSKNQADLVLTAGDTTYSPRKDVVYKNENAIIIRNNLSNLNDEDTLVKVGVSTNTTAALETNEWYNFGSDGKIIFPTQQKLLSGGIDPQNRANFEAILNKLKLEKMQNDEKKYKIIVEDHDELAASIHEAVSISIGFFKKDANGDIDLIAGESDTAVYPLVNIQPIVKIGELDYVTKTDSNLSSLLEGKKIYDKNFFTPKYLDTKKNDEKIIFKQVIYNCGRDEQCSLDTKFDNLEEPLSIGIQKHEVYDKVNNNIVIYWIIDPAYIKQNKIYSNGNKIKPATDFDTATELIRNDITFNRNTKSTKIDCHNDWTVELQTKGLSGNKGVGLNNRQFQLSRRIINSNANINKEDILLKDLKIVEDSEDSIIFTGKEQENDNFSKYFSVSNNDDHIVFNLKEGKTIDENFKTKFLDDESATFKAVFTDNSITQNAQDFETEIEIIKVPFEITLNSLTLQANDGKQEITTSDVSTTLKLSPIHQQETNFSDLKIIYYGEDNQPFGSSYKLVTGNLAPTWNFQDQGEPLTFALTHHKEWMLQGDYSYNVAVEYKIGSDSYLTNKVHITYQQNKQITVVTNGTDSILKSDGDKNKFEAKINFNNFKPQEIILNNLAVKIQDSSDSGKNFEIPEWIWVNKKIEGNEVIFSLNAHYDPSFFKDDLANYIRTHNDADFKLVFSYSDTNVTINVSEDAGKFKFGIPTHDTEIVLDPDASTMIAIEPLEYKFDGDVVTAGTTTKFKIIDSVTREEITKSSIADQKFFIKTEKSKIDTWYKLFNSGTVGDINNFITDYCSELDGGTEYTVDITTLLVLEYTDPYWNLNFNETKMGSSKDIPQIKDLYMSYKVDGVETSIKKQTGIKIVSNTEVDASKIIGKSSVDTTVEINEYFNEAYDSNKIQEKAVSAVTKKCNELAEVNNNFFNLLKYEDKKVIFSDNDFDSIKTSIVNSDLTKTEANCYIKYNNKRDKSFIIPVASDGETVLVPVELNINFVVKFSTTVTNLQTIFKQIYDNKTIIMGIVNRPGSPFESIINNCALFKNIINKTNNTYYLDIGTVFLPKEDQINMSDILEKIGILRNDLDIIDDAATQIGSEYMNDITQITESTKLIRNALDAIFFTDLHLVIGNGFVTLAPIQSSSEKQHVHTGSIDILYIKNR